MSLRSYFARLERERRKARRQRVRDNVRAYRQRIQAAGFRRIELTLTEHDYKALCALVRPGEPMGAALSRLIAGNRESVRKAQQKQR